MPSVNAVPANSTGLAVPSSYGHRGLPPRSWYGAGAPQSVGTDCPWRLPPVPRWPGEGRAHHGRLRAERPGPTLTFASTRYACLLRWRGSHTSSSCLSTPRLRAWACKIWHRLLAQTVQFTRLVAAMWVGSLFCRPHLSRFPLLSHL